MTMMTGPDQATEILRSGRTIGNKTWRLTRILMSASPESFVLLPCAIVIRSLARVNVGARYFACTILGVLFFGRYVGVYTLFALEGCYLCSTLLAVVLLIHFLSCCSTTDSSALSSSAQSFSTYCIMSFIAGLLSNFILFESCKILFAFEMNLESEI